ncbi:endospore germination permease [Aneurinibacillus sp. Ricciae_BoGa-3]|uniref:GerAB/ArcD/ProY family transporter n=1 Tax=Aneurinibacillus sp. Ricciae_BoGa-3 TaxID=3022697 RepID=UPI0023426D8F|nr:endospore germination permease [Aneurinibacillus sp. Ricciae_BoGa-3]WCK54544.1 endospore germination permease [Aneurinibacillus sp. Ricciae_BoGa-3]
MLEKGMIGVKQLFIYIIMFTIGSSILVAPSGLVRDGKQDGWMASILDMGIGLLFVWLYYTLSQRFPKLTLVEFSEEIFGKWIGKVVSLSFLLYFFILAFSLLREIGDFMTTQILPKTPIEFIFMTFLGIVIMGTRLGLETQARAAEIFFPWIFLLFLIMVVSMLPEIHVENMQPMLEGGIKPVIWATYRNLGLPYLEQVVFLMVFPYVHRIEKARKALWGGTLFGGMMITIVTLLSILVITPDLTAIQIYPSYVLAKKISIGHFFERIEAVMAGIWFLTLFFKLTLCFYATALGVAQTLKLRDYRFLTFPLGMLLLVLSIVGSPNIIYFQRFIAEIWTPYSMTYGLFLPLLLLGVAMFRKKCSN